jgi:hypothetical protein
VVAAEAENVADATGDSVIFSRSVSRIGLMMMSTGFKCQPMIGRISDVTRVVSHRLAL